MPEAEACYTWWQLRTTTPFPSWLLASSRSGAKGQDGNDSVLAKLVEHGQKTAPKTPNDAASENPSDATPDRHLRRSVPATLTAKLEHDHRRGETRTQRANQSEEGGLNAPPMSDARGAERGKEKRTER